MRRAQPPSPDAASDEVQALRRCTRDIVAISALPAIWATQAPAQVAGSLAEVLVDALRLEFAYVQVKAPDGAVTEVCYGSMGFLAADRLALVSRAVTPRLQTQDRISVSSDLPNPLAPGAVQLVVISLGLGQKLGALVVASRQQTFPLETERLVLNVASNQAAIVLERHWTTVALQKSQQQRAELYSREEKRSRQLAQLAQASLAINSAQSLAMTLRLVAESARKIIGCHVAFVRAASDAKGPGTVGAASMSEKYEGGAPRGAPPTGSGLELLVSRTRRPLRLTEAELQAHPEGEKSSGAWQPPLRGCLAAPLVGRNGRPVGTILLSDRLTEEFTEDDEVILIQLSQMAGVALENTYLYEEAKQERDLAEAARTELRRVTETLKDSAARLDLAVRTAHLGIFDWNIVSDVHVWSEEACRFFGYEPGQFPGTFDGFMNRVHPEDRERVVEAIRTTLREDSEYLIEYRTRWPDGTVRWVSARGRVFRDAGGKPARLLGTLLDISEQKRVEQALRAAVEARHDFLSIASHELKTPIASLKMQLQLTQRRLEGAAGGIAALPPEQLSRALAISLRQVNRLTSLVEDLLDVSRIQAGRLDFRFEQVDLSALVREVVERLFDQLAAVGCAVEVVAAEPLWVECDRFRIEQVLVNLLSNAMKYGAGKPVKVTTESSNGSVRFLVHDAGIGIPVAEQERIFERFGRAVPDRNISGLGLGLYIVKQILLGHHGHVQVRSEPGKGSTFTVELPVRQPVLEPLSAIRSGG